MQKILIMLTVYHNQCSFFYLKNWQYSFLAGRKIWKRPLSSWQKKYINTLFIMHKFIVQAFKNA
jgi:hypothetical protein